MVTPLPSRASDSPYYTNPSFVSETLPVFHGFFGRQGGVSTGIYESLNCGFGAEDLPEAVQENRGIIASCAGVEKSKLLTVYQEHGDKCIVVSDTWEHENRPHGDAMVTDVPGIGLGILTADCTPVLFYGEKQDGSPVIGAAHAGWRGALAGILESTLDAMKNLGVVQETVRACVGPCIQKRSYEVSEEFLRRFLEHMSENERFFMNGQRPDHYQFDLSGYCASRLSNAGVSSVDMMDLDTYALEDRFFSNRRAFHRKEPDYGRQISVIALQVV